MRFENKTVLITGAGQGIGRAYAHEFAKAGAAVVIADLNIEKAQAVAAEILAENGKALAVKVDVSDSERGSPFTREQEAAILKASPLPYAGFEDAFIRDPVLKFRARDAADL